MAYDVIRTKYHGPSGARGGRIRATWGRDSLTMDYPHEVAGQEERHAHVAAALVRKLGKSGALHAGWDERTKTYEFIFSNVERPHGATYSTETGNRVGDEAAETVTEGFRPPVIWQPFIDGPRVGYRVMCRGTGEVTYLYLNPSTEGEGEPDVFVYCGPDNDPSKDATVIYLTPAFKSDEGR